MCIKANILKKLPVHAEKSQKAALCRQHKLQNINETKSCQVSNWAAVQIIKRGDEFTKFLKIPSHEASQ